LLFLLLTRRLLFSGHYHSSVSPLRSLLWIRNPSLAEPVLQGIVFYIVKIVIRIGVATNVMYKLFDEGRRRGKNKEDRCVVAAASLQHSLLYSYRHCFSPFYGRRERHRKILMLKKPLIRVFSLKLSTLSIVHLKKKGNDFT
jgi:hypothetical protein